FGLPTWQSLQLGKVVEEEKEVYPWGNWVAGLCKVGPCGVILLGTWQFKSPRVITLIARLVLACYKLGNFGRNGPWSKTLPK
ncbi:hypothetical protein Tco_1472614, partial [Tanacetum coccineum]